MGLIPTPGPTELIIILAVVLIIFGPKQLPKLGKSLGKTVKAVREGVEGKGDDDEDEVVEPAPKKKAAVAAEDEEE